MRLAALFRRDYTALLLYYYIMVLHVLSSCNTSYFKLHDYIQRGCAFPMLRLPFDGGQHPRSFGRSSGQQGRRHWL